MNGPILLKTNTMLDIKQFISAIDQIAEEKGIDRQSISDVIEQALAAAYKKDYGERGQNKFVKLDSKSGKAEFFQSFLVLNGDMIYSEEEIEAMVTERQKAREGAKEKTDEKKKSKESQNEGEPEELGDEEDKKVRVNPKRHRMLAEAKKIKKSAEVGEEVAVALESQEEFGRIAAQTAKQVIIQRIREVERNVVYEIFKEKEGEIVSGTIQRIERGIIYLDIGLTTGVIFLE